MATRKQVMQALVKEEAKNLRKNLTTEEKNNLDFDYLNPEDYKRCVYGLATGDCKSTRASELINSCCSRVYTSNWGNVLAECPVNGAPSGQNRGELEINENEKIAYWSPIEVFIVQKGNMINGNNEKLIKYLKGEISRLNFN